MAISTIPVTHVLLAGAGVIGLWFIYELLFSPLRNIPGPFISRFTNLYRAGLTLGGHVDDKFRSWHEQYGSTVRVAPNAVSIGDPDLIKVIYATKNAWIKVRGSLQHYYLVYLITPLM